jgi:hypothetical protein
MAHSTQVYSSNLRNLYNYNSLMLNNFSPQAQFELLRKRTFQENFFQETLKKVRTDPSNEMVKGLNPMVNTSSVLNYHVPSMTPFSFDTQNGVNFASTYPINMQLFMPNLDYNQQIYANIQAKLPDISNEASFPGMANSAKSDLSFQAQTFTTNTIEANEDHAKMDNKFGSEDQSWFINIKSETSDDRSTSEQNSQTKEGSTSKTVECKRRNDKRKVGRPRKDSLPSEADSVKKTTKSLKKILDEDISDEDLAVERREDNSVVGSEFSEPILVEYTRQFPDWDLETIFRFLRSSKSQIQFQKDKEARVVRACIGAQKKNKNSLRVF